MTAAKSPVADAPRLAKEERSDSKSVELGRTRTNSNTPKNGKLVAKKPMNYEEWSKSIELDQTLTPNLSMAG